MATQAESEKAMWLKVAEAVIAILVTISISVTSWNSVQIVQLSNDVAALKAIATQIADNNVILVQLQKDLAEIKGNRFTSSDGLAVWKEIAQIREQIAKLPNEFPPKWFIERLDKLEQSMDRRLSSLEAKFDAHQREKP